MNTKDIIERIKQLEKDISSAETKISIYENRLSELKNKIQTNDAECKKELEMSIKELPEYIKTNEIKIVKLLDDLESEHSKIKEGHEE